MSNDASRLNARQRAFVDAFTGGDDGVRGNATKAAAAAGYRQPHVHGCRLLKNVKVAAAIAERQDAAARAAQLTLEQYVEQCLEQARWYKRNGKRPDTASVKALELVGKALGFIDRGTVAVQGGPIGVEILPRRVALTERGSLPPELEVAS